LLDNKLSLVNKLLRINFIKLSKLYNLVLFRKQQIHINKIVLNRYSHNKFEIIFWWRLFKMWFSREKSNIFRCFQNINPFCLIRVLAMRKFLLSRGYPFLNHYNKLLWSMDNGHLHESYKYRYNINSLY